MEGMIDGAAREEENQMASMSVESSRLSTLMLAILLLIVLSVSRRIEEMERKVERCNL